ncbi:hypothetical protein FB45DRAFT_873113 [Roridomyces roridus]|uniref:Uncharacterized protein n=1 Tax=Roridomyces roridus TaxID=1738132 RepID=A0AAD7BCE3_9AGAR|nr:hypothetical protein FB45DRAFT_873113 [Roridomyces roridus]
MFAFHSVNDDDASHFMNQGRITMSMASVSRKEAGMNLRAMEEPGKALGEHSSLLTRPDVMMKSRYGQFEVRRHDLGERGSGSDADEEARSKSGNQITTGTLSLVTGLRADTLQAIVMSFIVPHSTVQSTIRNRAVQTRPPTNLALAFVAYLREEILSQVKASGTYVLTLGVQQAGITWGSNDKNSLATTVKHEGLAWNRQWNRLVRPSQRGK